jgi:hypothetical protein
MAMMGCGASAGNDSDSSSSCKEIRAQDAREYGSKESERGSEARNEGSREIERERRERERERERRRERETQRERERETQREARGEERQASCRRHLGRITVCNHVLGQVRVDLPAPCEGGSVHTHSPTLQTRARQSAQEAGGQARQQAKTREHPLPRANQAHGSVRRTMRAARVAWDFPAEC